MTQFFCPSCRVRFSRSPVASTDCPECRGALEPLAHARDALGLPLYVERFEHTPVLDAAIAAARASLEPTLA
jgi:hypothetical protein